MLANVHGGESESEGGCPSHEAGDESSSYQFAVVFHQAVVHQLEVREKCSGP